MNAITFESKMAMANAMAAVFCPHSVLTESTQVQECGNKNIRECGGQNVQECGNQGITECGNVTESKKGAKPVMDNKPVKKACGAECETDTVRQRVEDFHKQRAAKRKLCIRTKPAECKGGKCVNEDEGQAATPVKAKKPVEEEPVEGGEEGGAEGVEGTEGAEGGDNAELTAHASAVSERIQAMREKLVSELDADDGLRMSAGGEEDAEGAEGGIDGDTETVNNQGADEQ